MGFCSKDFERIVKKLKYEFSVNWNNLYNCIIFNCNIFNSILYFTIIKGKNIKNIFVELEIINSRAPRESSKYSDSEFYNLLFIVA